MEDFTLMVITDGRLECLERTLDSAERNLPRPHHSLLINDSQDEKFSHAIDEEYGFDFEIIHLRPKRGFAGAIQAGWQRVALLSPQWVFHLEDDFTFEGMVPLEHMMRVIDHNPHVKQMILKRQSWSPAEAEAGGYIESRPDEYKQMANSFGDFWLEQRLFWSTNPGLYRRETVELGWPSAPGSEGAFSEKIFSDPDFVCGVWGLKFEMPRVEHIGLQRVGNGY